LSKRIAYLNDPDSYAGWSFYTPVRATQARQVEGHSYPGHWGTQSPRHEKVTAHAGVAIISAEVSVRYMISTINTWLCGK